MAATPSSGTPSAGAPHLWHQALALAVTGRPWPDLPSQEAPDPVGLAARLSSDEGEEQLRRHVREMVASGERWPHPVPPELMVGLGHAQFTAALHQLRSELRLDPTEVTTTPSAKPRPESAMERRLREEVPPHHGT